MTAGSVKKYRAAFFDVDGTLLSHSTGEVPGSTLDALGRMRERGVKLVLCTGRHPTELPDLNIDISRFDDFITTNGQIVLNGRKEVIAENPIPADKVQILVRAFEEGGIAMQFNSMDQLYMNRVDDRVAGILAEIHTPVHELGDYRGETLYQVVAYPKESDRDWVEGLKEHFHVTSWHPNGIDIITKGGGKDWGMRAYLELAGIGREETIAFGDGENDLAMIRFAGCGVAMGNGAEILKEAADDVALDIDDDGLYQACLKHGLL